MIEEEVLKSIKRTTEITNVNSLQKNVSIYYGKYMIQSLIYCGENAFVYTALNVFNNEKVVIKEFFPRNLIEIDNESLEFIRTANGSMELLNYSCKKFDIFLNLIDKFLKEVEYLKELSKSKYIVTINESFQVNNTSYIVLEYIEYPTFKEVMTSNKKISPDNLMDLYYSLLDATDFIHSKNIIHRDLKPSNLFVTPYGIIIGDFGISKYLDEIKLSNTAVYSESFSAPEQVSGAGNQGTWTDIYSLGKILEYLIIKVGYTEEFYTKEKALKNGFDIMSVIIDKTTLVEFISDACNIDTNLRIGNINSVKNKLIRNKKASLNDNKILHIIITITACIILIFIILCSKWSYTNEYVRIKNFTIIDLEVVKSKLNKEEFNSLDKIVLDNKVSYKFYTKDSKLDMNFYSFSALGKKTIEINGFIVTTEYKILDLFGNEFYREYIVDSSNFDISHIILKEGVYYIVINNNLSDKQLYCDITMISVISDKKSRCDVFSAIYNTKIVDWHDLENCKTIIFKTCPLVLEKDNRFEIEIKKIEYDLNFLNLDYENTKYK